MRSFVYGDKMYMGCTSLKAENDNYDYYGGVDGADGIPHPHSIPF